MYNILNECTLCPHQCKVNRTKGILGKCRADDKIKVALVSLHRYEEPCISKEHGSGTIFFSNCNLKCVFCQNYKISQEGIGNEYTIEKLADEMILLQNKGANNINLVTPTIYVPQIIKSIEIARKNGLNIPIIYNSSGYESIQTLDMLKGYIDVYLPDFKYFNNEIAKKYSKIDNYFEYTSKAILQMYKQVGNPVFNSDGIIQKGLIIRHMILPNHIHETKSIIEWVEKNIGKEAYISIMAQYFPTNNAGKYEEINRKINRVELKMVERYLYNSGLENGYIQKLGRCEEKYVPDFIGKESKN